MIILVLILVVILVVNLLRFAFSVKVVKPTQAQVQQTKQDVQALERQKEFSWRSRQLSTVSTETTAANTFRSRAEIPAPTPTPTPAPVESNIWDAAIRRAEARQEARGQKIEYDSHGDAMNVVRARGSRR
jgi:cytoskeletal protein RodZ